MIEMDHLVVEREEKTRREREVPISVCNRQSLEFYDNGEEVDGCWILNLVLTCFL